jgi:hypothetical protein
MRPALLALLSVSCALAQPPNLIRLVRQGTIQPYVAIQALVNVLSTSVIAGPSENWLIEMHDSFASLENVDRALRRSSPLQTKDAAPFPDLLARSQTLVASYLPALSYRADEGMQLFPKMRYLDFAVIRIRLGTEADLARLLKLRSFSLDSINADRPAIVYQVVSGAPSGTYVVLSPMTSLGTLDIARVTPLSMLKRPKRLPERWPPTRNSSGNICGCALSPGRVMYPINSRRKTQTSGARPSRCPPALLRFYRRSCSDPQRSSVPASRRAFPRRSTGLSMRGSLPP